MATDRISTEGLTRTIADIAGDVRRAFIAERGEEHDERLLRASMTEVVAEKIDTLERGLHEMFTSPERGEFQQLAGIVERRSLENKITAVEESVELAQEFGDDSVFTGRTVFSKRKMAAMIEYLTAKGHHVYKTSLNKMLFYADLTNFYLTGRGMSGAVYYNRPFGPVADPAGPILSELVNEEKVKVDPRMQTLAAATAEAAEELTDGERKVLDWVAQTYGPMSAGQVSEYSHAEMAYKYTEPNEPIAYAYGQFFKQLPPKDLLQQAK